MADDDDVAQSSSSSISIPTMVDGLTPMERRTVIRILKDQVVKDFSHYYVKRKQNHLETTTSTSMAENYTVVHPRYVFNPSDEPLLEYLYLDYLTRGKDMKDPAWLMPVIPMVLINGAMGGRKYDPWDVIDYFRQRLLKKKKDKEEPVPVQLRLWEKTEPSSPPAPPDDDHQARAQTTDLVTTTLLDKEGGKKKYTLEELLEEFFTLRLKSYEERMSAMHEVIESAVDELAEETCKHDGECFDSENMVLGYSLKQEVLYAETKNQILRSTGWPMYDIEVGSRHQSTEWWSEILRVFDILEDRISPKRLWWNDLDALEEELDIQYKKLEPSKMRLSSVQKWLAYVKNKDEPKTGLKRIWVSDSDSDSESGEEDSGDDEE